MKELPTITLAVLFVGFWGVVLWAADAFSPWELASILAVIVVLSFFGWALGRMAGLADRREEEARARTRARAFDWRHEDDPWLRRLDEHEARVAAKFEAHGVDYWGTEDVSDVRNPGLGR